MGFGWTKSMGGLETRPYGLGNHIFKVDYSVDVIWHDYEFVYNSFRVVAR